MRHIIKEKEQKEAEDLNISIVTCGGKSKLEKFYNLYSNLGIECFVLFDGDGSDENNTSLNETLKKLRYYCIPKDLENFLFKANCFVKSEHLSDEEKGVIGKLNNKYFIDNKLLNGGEKITFINLFINLWIDNKINPQEKQNKVDEIWGKIKNFIEA